MRRLILGLAAIFALALAAPAEAQFCTGKCGGNSGTVTSVGGTVGQVNVATPTSTPIISLAMAVTFPGTVTNPLSIFGSTTSAQLLGVMSDATGTGSLVFAGGNIGAASATSLALGACTPGANQLCLTGSASIAGAIAVTGNVASSNQVRGASLAAGGCTIGTNSLCNTGTIVFNSLTTDVGKTDSSVCIDSTTGQIYKGTGTLGICLGTSSARYKRDIADGGDGLPVIDMLRPVTFRYLNGFGDDGARLQRGFIAEDVVKVIPGLVGLDANGRPNTVDLMGMTPVMVKAIQQLSAKNEALQKRLAADDARLVALESRAGIVTTASGRSWLARTLGL